MQGRKEGRYKELKDMGSKEARMMDLNEGEKIGGGRGRWRFKKPRAIKKQQSM